MLRKKITFALLGLLLLFSINIQSSHRAQSSQRKQPTTPRTLNNQKNTTPKKANTTDAQNAAIIQNLINRWNKFDQQSRRWAGATCCMFWPTIAAIASTAFDNQDWPNFVSRHQETMVLTGTAMTVTSFITTYNMLQAKYQLAQELRQYDPALIQQIAGESHCLSQQAIQRSL